MKCISEVKQATININMSRHSIIQPVGSAMFRFADNGQNWKQCLCVMQIWNKLTLKTRLFYTRYEEHFLPLIYLIKNIRNSVRIRPNKPLNLRMGHRGRGMVEKVQNSLCLHISRIRSKAQEYCWTFRNEADKVKEISKGNLLGNSNHKIIK